MLALFLRDHNTALPNGMAQPGQQVAAAQTGCAVGLAVPPVLCALVALGLEHVGGCVGHLPVPTPRWRPLRSALRCQRRRGDTAGVRAWLARLRLEHGDRHPSARPGGSATSPQDSVERAREGYGQAAAMLAPLACQKATRA